MSQKLIAIVAPQGVQALDVTGPADVFSEAVAQMGTPAYRVQVIGATTAPVTCSSGVILLPQRTIHDPDEPIDTLLVAGAPARGDASETADLVAWVARRAPSTRRFGSVCTGTFVLAAAGLLSGRTVTTHWQHAAELAATCPEARVEPDRLFVRDGPLCTSAGVTAGIDLALALIEEDHGRALALAVARRLVVFLKRPGGQSQFSAHLAAQIATKSPVQTVQGWVLENLSASLSVDVLARRAGMSVRNFARVFRAEAGLTPADFVEAARVDSARRMLEDTVLPLQRVAARCGFTNVDGLRRAFMRRIGVGPHDYRARFRSTTGSPAPVNNRIGANLAQ
jgi:transcriptional regulator GlxA family with amidase domain